MIIYLFAACIFAQDVTRTPPPNVFRGDYTFDWCDCSTGKKAVEIWPGNDRSQSIKLLQEPAPAYITWKEPVDEIGWICDGMKKEQRSKMNVPFRVWGIKHFVEAKDTCFTSKDKNSGRLHFSGYAPTNYSTSIPISSGEGGYFCIKIPVLVLTQNRTLLAIGEARMDSCSDFAWTDLVMKKSYDMGKTWGPLEVIRSESSPGSVPTVIGNAAPVEIQTSTGEYKILLPHTRNNSDVWLVESSDHGETWSKARQLPGMQSDWPWVATGPPNSIRLRSGRIVVPSYHGPYRGNLINNIVHGHTMLSDDEGKTWRLGAANGFGNANHLVNENSVVELSDGTVLANGRSSTTKRLQARSTDGGETFSEPEHVDLPQPAGGCQGSTVSGQGKTLYFSGPDSEVLRTAMTWWESPDEGKTWNKKDLLDKGMSGYSSLQYDAKMNKLYLLYEQTDDDQLVMNPDRLIFRVIDLDN